MGKWEEQIKSEDALKKVITKRFTGVFNKARLIKEFDCELYFKLVEKITVYDGKLVLSLLDGSEIECEIE